MSFVWDARFSRRGALVAGWLASGALGVFDITRLQAQARNSRKALGQQSVIFVELAGGQSQFESYDPKPDAPVEYRGEFDAIPTNIPGIQFSELMPEQARVADKLAVVRSISHENSNHGASAHLTQTGYYMSGPKEGPNEMPCFGSVLARVRGQMVNSLPSYVAVPVVMRYGKAAYLGPACNPFEIMNDPNGPDFAIPNLTLCTAMPVDRLESRIRLREAFDRAQRLSDLHGESQSVDEFSQRAFELVHGRRARDAFEISQEPDSLRDRYGRTTVGQSLLLARRLAAAGVPCITVRCTGWDDHTELPKGVKQRSPAYDQGMAALVTDLYDRGLDRDVLVVAMGEFGRTPRVNGAAGRDHWGALMSVVFAGGGLKPQILGESNSKGEYPVRAPYRPENVLAMIYRHLGIDPAVTFNDSFGRPRHLLDERGLIRELL